MKALQMRTVFLLALFYMFSTQQANAQQFSNKRSYPDSVYGVVIQNLSVKLVNYLKHHVKGFELPGIQEFDPDMLSWFYENRNAYEHPAICAGDFNSDDLTDFGLILKSWRGGAILIILNGRFDSTFELFILDEVIGYTDDYLLFNDNQLYKGNFEKDGIHVEWDKEQETYRTWGY